MVIDLIRSISNFWVQVLTPDIKLVLIVKSALLEVLLIRCVDGL